ncbi:uncharacterized protein LOC136713155 isoform X2 [Amia ocellicauda]|uniref:uncharacterized protein LOC136713155 isoform X2 n=1 Tax=Amia ocellicauda TaxID=2972642 RepID=UPI003463ADB6
MSEEKRVAAVAAGLGQGARVDSVRTAIGQEMTHIRDLPHSQRFAHKPTPVSYRGGRPMHQSTLRLGGRPSETSYTTTQAHYFSGRGSHGQLLRGVPRVPQYPSQHHGRLDLGTLTLEHCQPHSRDTFGPKEITPHYILHESGVKNRHHNQHSLAMREITNPSGEQKDYRSTYRTEHCSETLPSASTSCRGLPTDWHNYNIITV